MLLKRIEKKTIEIIEDLKINKLPIPVELIASKRGLTIQPFDLGDEVSGVLVINNFGEGTIGVNPLESKVRQRFTIAHELGHFELHKQDGEIFIDKQFKVLFRDQNSSKGEIKKEQEANAFAAAILMPEKLLIKEILRNSFDLTDGQSMKTLATLFNVSTTAMTFRIANLNLFDKLSQ